MENCWKIQVSNGGAAFFAGKSINNKEPKEQASIAGAVAMALHVRQMAKFYGIPVVLHSDHCAKKLLPWFDGMLQADEVSFVLSVHQPSFESIHGTPPSLTLASIRMRIMCTRASIVASLFVLPPPPPQGFTK